ncbi:FAD-binding oxidoreductase [Erysipelothrix sp. HDW6C]|uniref:FAD-binding oxidoreductase n=1 Tax=Erysipelothrix sp. HDW6C TaxID=2714930 RepID=UPI00140952AB|nr:FAD-binding oxidoreductase [Erysipelothrix sp. HDW6C]QIK69656.1 FAD-binding oxidoreductase [Erysipelothrix sp. HDW6C]
MTLNEVIKDKSRIYTGDNVPHDYLYDEYVGTAPSVHAVVLPINHDEVVAAVKYANDHDLKIIARGAGTGLSGATAPQFNELIIDLSLMNRIHGLDEKTMTLTVEPGVLLHEIQEYVESRRFFYPPDPGSKNSSIGGNVATNAGGMRAVKYGVTRNYVKEMTVVLATGETMVLGSLNVKSSSGYDLKDLFIGSEGTLGITTLIRLKVIPLPMHKLSYVLAFEDLQEATRTVAAILQEGIDPTSLEFFEREMIEISVKETGIAFPTEKGKSFLLMTIDGDSMDHIYARGARLETVANAHGVVDFLTLESAQLESDVWKLRDSLLSAVVNYTEQVTMDETVPINHVATLYAYTKDLEAEYGVQLMSFGHAGDGNLHTCVMRGNLDQATWDEKRHLILDKLYAKIAELGGLPSAEHGIGLIKKPYFEAMTAPVNLEAMRAIKNAFDPHHRLNPNKVL